MSLVSTVFRYVNPKWKIRGFPEEACKPSILRALCRRRWTSFWSPLLSLCSLFKRVSLLVQHCLSHAPQKVLHVQCQEINLGWIDLACYHHCRVPDVHAYSQDVRDSRSRSLVIARMNVARLLAVLCGAWGECNQVGRVTVNLHQGRVPHLPHLPLDCTTANKSSICSLGGTCCGAGSCRQNISLHTPQWCCSE